MPPNVRQLKNNYSRNECGWNEIDKKWVQLQEVRTCFDQELNEKELTWDGLDIRNEGLCGHILWSMNTDKWHR